jgi:hypothetical protein
LDSLFIWRLFNCTVGSACLLRKNVILFGFVIIFSEGFFKKPSLKMIKNPRKITFFLAEHLGRDATALISFLSSIQHKHLFESQHYVSQLPLPIQLTIQ